VSGVQISSRAGAIALVGIGAALLVAYAADVFLLLFAGILTAIALRGLARHLSAYLGIGDGAALACAVLLIVAVLALIGWLFWPDIPGEIDALRSALPQAVQSIRERLARFTWLNRLVEELPSPTQIATPANVLGKITGFFSTTLGAVANTFIVAVLGLYLAVNPRLYACGFAALFPKTRRSRVIAVLDETGSALGWWLAGKSLSMAAVGILTALGL
jgi:predicted PurR-regulated permease PerM